MKNILIVEPFFTGSHKVWAEGYAKNSRHNVSIISLPGRHWKWRMHGGAIPLAEKFNELQQEFDYILVSDMLDLALFKSMIKTSAKFAVYFHENQLSYPWSDNDPDKKGGRDANYAFINYTSSLIADLVIFNSNYHKNSYLESLREFLSVFPDYNNLESVTKIQNKSIVLYPGFDFSKYKCIKSRNKVPLVLWNHRWEYDKNPEDFFELLIKAHSEGYDFEVALLGEKFKEMPECFVKAQKVLGNKIITAGKVEFNEYLLYLQKADILPVTSNQDFFGISILEAIYCGAYPLLPERLTYPELYSNEEFKNCFYKNNDEMYSKFTQLLKREIPTLNTTSINKFDWKQNVEFYDNVFERWEKQTV